MATPDSKDCITLISHLRSLPRLPALSALCLAGLAACGIPPVDTATISTTPANAASFAVAQQAVRACIDMDERDTQIRNFRRAGFDVTISSQGQITVTAPDDAVTVLLHHRSCWVGLEYMTPQQSVQLAQIWVDAYDATSNAANGQGLSSHVANAWRNIFTEPEVFPETPAYRHTIYIAAYKTWPSGPYDPQRGTSFDLGDPFPDVPGAAVSLRHNVACKSPFPGGGPGSIMQCDGPAYRPG